MIQITCTKDLCRIIREKKQIADTKNTSRLHHFIEKDRLGKYLYGALSIDIDEEHLGEKISSSIILENSTKNI